MKYMLYILCLFILSCDSNNPAASESVYGCTDQTACNFNPDANIFDNTCLYGLEEGAIDYEIFTQYLYDCDGSCLQYLGCDAICYFEEGLDDLDDDAICDNIDECVGYYSCSEGCVEPDYLDNLSSTQPSEDNIDIIIPDCNDFTSITLTDEFGTELGYEGIQSNSGACYTISRTIDWNLPTDLSLYSNYPNPFNPITSFEIQTPVSGHIEIKIIDPNFNEIEIIHDGVLDAGNYSFTWNGSSVPIGYYRIVASSSQETCYTNIRMLED